jgi:hypothetical protein
MLLASLTQCATPILPSPEGHPSFLWPIYSAEINQNCIEVGNWKHSLSRVEPQKYTLFEVRRNVTLNTFCQYTPDMVIGKRWASRLRAHFYSKNTRSETSDSRLEGARDSEVDN